MPVRIRRARPVRWADFVTYVNCGAAHPVTQEREQHHPQRDRAAPAHEPLSSGPLLMHFSYCRKTCAISVMRSRPTGSIASQYAVWVDATSISHMPLTQGDLACRLARGRGGFPGGRVNGAQALLRTMAGSGVEVCFSNPGPRRCTSWPAWTRPGAARRVCLFEGVAPGRRTATAGWRAARSHPAASGAGPGERPGQPP